MKNVAKKIGSTRYQAWLEAPIIAIGHTRYTRDSLNDIGIGLHTIAARRLADAIQNNDLTLGEIAKMGYQGLRRFEGVGETTCIVAAYLLIQHGYDAIKWIGAKGNSYRGAMANAKAKSKDRIPGRGRRQTKK